MQPGETQNRAIIYAWMSRRWKTSGSHPVGCHNQGIPLLNPHIAIMQEALLLQDMVLQHQK